MVILGSAPPATHGPWLGIATVQLSAADIADSLALAIGALLTTAQRRFTPAQRISILAGLAVPVAVAATALPFDGLVGCIAVWVMASLLLFARIPHRVLTLLMVGAAGVISQRKIGEAATAAWNQAGLHLSRQGSAVMTLWSEIAGWDEGRAIVLHKPASGYIMLSTRCLTASEADQIRAALQAAGVPGLYETDTRKAAPPEAIPLSDAPGPRRLVFRLTEAELVEASRCQIIQRLPTPPTLWTVAVAAGLIWWQGWSVVSVGALGTAAVSGVAVAILLRLVLPWLMSPVSVRRSMRHARSLTADCQIEWDEVGFHGVYLNGDVVRPWTEVQRWYRADHVVLLSLNGNFGQTISLRALDAGQLADLEACAAAAKVRGARRA